VTANVSLGAEVEIAALPSAPTLRGSLRAAALDFYYNSWRVVPANMLWGLVLIGLYVLFLVWPFGALLFLPLLALPTVGLYRMAALIVRGESVSFWDGIGAWRRYLVPSLATGLGMVLAGTVFTVNMVDGLASGDPIGWAFATFAGWGLLTMSLLAVSFWPLLVDPARDGWGARRALRLAGYLVVAHPLRLAGLVVATAVVLVVSTIAFAALVTISVALTALFGSHFVLASADRLEARLGERGITFAPGLTYLPSGSIAGR
jgi:hypothetical protein